MLWLQQESAQESALEQGPYYENCTKHLHSNQDGIWEREQISPKHKQKWFYIQAHTHKAIQCDELIDLINSNILCCKGFVLFFKTWESTHRKTRKANFVCVCEWVPIMLCSNLLPWHIQSVDISFWHTASSVCLLCMHEGLLDRNVRDAKEDRTFHRVSTFSCLNPQFCGAMKTKMSTIHFVFLSPLTSPSQKRCSGHQWSTQT